MRLRLCAFASGAALVACGLDLVGSAGADPSVSTHDAASPSGPASASADESDGGELASTDAAVEEETPVDAGTVPSIPCGASSLVDNFATDLSKWTAYGGVDLGQNGSNSFARLIADGTPSRAAGLFWIPTVRAKSFKARFAFHATKPVGSGSAGDGLTFTWLTSTEGLPIGQGAVVGQGLGLQPGVDGFAFALDSYTNSSIGDPTSPSFSLLRIEEEKGTPGSYDWHMFKSGPWGGVYGAWHDVVVTVANGKVSVSVATTRVISDISVDDSSRIVALGFTASTGGSMPIGWSVDSVAIELTGATCN